MWLNIFWKGKIFAGKTVVEALEAEKIKLDFAWKQ